jgi:glycosyltransferase involved in cell wall biosynthesis
LTVLRGFEAAARQLPDATLTMIFANGELGADVRQCVDRSDILRARVRLPGRVSHDRVAGYASAADLFVLGSHRESCGYALLEACACGAAPVVSDIPSFRAITGSGSIGALWPPGDAEGCARALIAAADGDPRIRSERVRAHFARALSWPAVAARASAAYADVVARVRARSGVLH